MYGDGTIKAISKLVACSIILIPSSIYVKDASKQVMA